MNFEEIMQEITSGLTGDNNADFVYLNTQMEKYKHHKMSKEILRACGRLIYKTLPEDKKANLSNAFNNDFTAWNATLDEVRFNRYKKDNKKALELIESLVNKTEDLLNAGLFSDDEVSEYHCFFEHFEQVLYEFIQKPDKTLRRANGFPIAEVYLEYGSLLIDLERIDDAQAALAKAVHWAPTNGQIAFEYAETFKMLGDMERFFKYTLKTFKFAFKPLDVARCYRNIGFYFVENKLWREAAACFLMSLQFDRESKNAQLELYYIREHADKQFQEPGMTELEAFGKKYGFPIGADEDVVGIAFALGKQAMEHKQFNAAEYYLEIVYNLTDDEDVKKMMDNISNSVQ